MNPLLIFLAKDVRETRQVSYLWPIYLILPLITIGLTTAFMFIAPVFIRGLEGNNDPALQALRSIIATSMEFAGMPLEEAMTRYLLRNLLGLFLLMPIGLSSIAAAFSVVSEKQQRTLEPVLATPITDRQFLLGKLIAAVAPSILLTWASGLLSIVIADLISWRRYGQLLLPDRFWLVGIFLLAPLLCAASVLATMRISARLSDPQAANQFSGLVIVPIFVILIALFGKILTLNLAASLIACLLAALLALFLFRLNIRKFQREEILTRWK